MIGSNPIHEYVEVPLLSPNSSCLAPGLLNIKLVHRPLSSFLLSHLLLTPIHLRKQPSNGLVIYKGCGYAVLSVYARSESSIPSIVGGQFVVHAFGTVVAGDCP